jgi:hypothetical protein
MPCLLLPMRSTASVRTWLIFTHERFADSVSFWKIGEKTSGKVKIGGTFF